MSLQRPQRVLLGLIVVGGTAVLASYAWAFAVSDELRAGLWGGVPQWMQAYYTPSMFLAAAGFFPFTWLFAFRTDPRESPYSTVLLAYALILFPSAAWPTRFKSRSTGRPSSRAFRSEPCRTHTRMVR